MNWQANSWRNAAGRKVENPDLWKELNRLRRSVGIRVDIVWEKGKETELLRKVDKAAKQAARMPTGRDWKYRPGTVARSKVKGAARLFPAASQTIVVRPYRKNVIDRNEESIRFDIYSESENQFTGKGLAYATSELCALLHRNHSYRVKFNGEPKYPKIVELVEEVPSGH